MSDFSWTDNEKLCKSLLGIMKSEMAIEIWGTLNTKRSINSPRFGQAWEEVFIAASEVLGDE